MFGQQMPSVKQYNTIAQQLQQDYQVRRIDLTSGQVASDVDVLFVIAPQGMTDKEQYAIDQYLMRGGSVVLAAGNFILNPDPMAGGLAVQQVEGGLNEMLASYGITVDKAMVMDLQNEPFPVQVNRNLGGTPVREIQAVNYPFFVDVRPSGMDRQSPILASLPAVTLNWTSPITLDVAKTAGRQVTILLKSSPGSWLRTNSDIQPDLQTYPELGFPIEGQQAPQTLAVAVQGSFESYFKGKPSPLATTSVQTDTTKPAMQPQQPEQPGVGTIDRSPDTARLVVVGSAEFLNDVVFQLSASLSRDRYLNSLQFAQNTVDWSVEDVDLLSIRSRGTTSRLLIPLTDSQQSLWEAVNYAVALLALIGIGVLWRLRRRNEKPMDLLPRKPAQ
jgi:ABC-2 type transport system permease protein